MAKFNVPSTSITAWVTSRFALRRGVERGLLRETATVSAGEDSLRCAVEDDAEPLWMPSELEPVWTPRELDDEAASSASELPSVMICPLTAELDA